jgi:hypothetical protein
VADEIPETEVPSAPSPAEAAVRGFDAWLKHPNLPHMQALVGLLAGILTIGGFVYSYLWATTPIPPTRGEVIAVALDAKTDKPILDATLEVLTPKDALVSTLTPDSGGRARQTIKEGNYRLRASHPGFNAEVRQIHVIGGNSAEIRVRLAPRVAKAPTAQATPAPEPTSPTNPVGKTLDEGVSAVKKIFGQ